MREYLIYFIIDLPKDCTCAEQSALITQYYLSLRELEEWGLLIINHVHKQLSSAISRGTCQCINVKFVTQNRELC